MTKLIYAFIFGLFSLLGAIPSASEITEKWSRRGAQATPDFVKGVQRVRTAPGEMAAAKSDKYLAGIQENLTKWIRRVSGVSLQEWQRLTVEKGQQRYAQGIAAATAKTTAFWTEFLPVLESTKNAADAMPDLTLEDRINKAVFVMRSLSEFNRS